MLSTVRQSHSRAVFHFGYMTNFYKHVPRLIPIHRLHLSSETARVQQTKQHAAAHYSGSMINGENLFLLTVGSR